MKTNRLPNRASVVLAATMSLSLNAEEVTLVPTALVSIERDPRGAAPFVVISNAANQVWSIERSSNQRDWTSVATLKIHNGLGRHELANSPIGAVEFLRAAYDPARQDNLHDVTNALLLPGVPFNYATPALPASFSIQPILGQDNMPATNLTTDLGAQLGRVLFYDRRLSTNQSISCSSCHQQAHGFSDPRQFSVGFDGGLTGRNSMGLSNARWYQRRHFFWDERANTLEDQVLMPIQNSVEMGMDLTTLTNRLAAEPYYTNLFAATFGSPGITPDRIARALAQFVRSIVSVQAKYDAGVTNNFANFTLQENQGRQIFNGPAGGCAACHGTDNFVPGPALNNNGLEFPYVDLGVGGITGNPADNGKFKVPSLRNIALTAPFMHDGRFATLEQVVEFYNSGVVDNPNLSAPLRNPPGPPGSPPPGPRRLNLTQQQKDALVAFLRTLTDPNLATDPKLSDPFNYSDYAGN
jgi:cytochrome c peroxidase